MLVKTLVRFSTLYRSRGAGVKDRNAMINNILLNQDGTISSHDGGDVETTPLRHLSSRVSLGDGYRLRSFFRMLEAYPVLTELNAFMPELVRRYAKCPGQGCACDAFEHLEFCKTVEMIGFPGAPRLEIYTVFQGRARNDALEIKLFDIDLLLDMPVALGRLHHVIFGDRTDRFEFDTVYTLFEFIDGIAWALSFHNAPGQCGIGR